MTLNMHSCRARSSHLRWVIWVGLRRRAKFGVSLRRLILATHTRIILVDCRLEILQTPTNSPMDYEKRVWRKSATSA